LLDVITLPEGLKELEETVKRCSSLGPVLLLGREDRIEQVVAGLKAGAAGFVKQTASPRELRSAVLAVAGGRLWCETNLFRRILQYLPAVPYSRQPNLTKREHDVLSYVGLGKSNKEIANNLNVSEQSVKVYVSNLLRKAGCSTRSNLALHAITWGFAQDRPTSEKLWDDPSATPHVPPPLAIVHPAARGKKALA
jgi:DNA-binding NarL/FixJ family response regulator